jgi:MFS superfamily sulfate permease-like transporter
MCVVLSPFLAMLLGIVISMMMFAYDIGKGSVEVSIQRPVEKVPQIREGRIGGGTPDLPRRATTMGRVLHTHREAFHEAAHSTIVYRLTGALTFINAVAHMENLKRIAKPGVTVIINVRYLYSLDYDGTNAFFKMINQLDTILKTPVFLCGVNTFLRQHLEEEDWFQKLEEANPPRVFSSETSALKFIYPSTDDVTVEDIPNVPAKGFDREARSRFDSVSDHLSALGYITNPEPPSPALYHEEAPPPSPLDANLRANLQLSASGAFRRESPLKRSINLSKPNEPTD